MEKDGLVTRSFAAASLIDGVSDADRSKQRRRQIITVGVILGAVALTAAACVEINWSRCRSGSPSGIAARQLCNVSAKTLHTLGVSG